MTDPDEVKLLPCDLPPEMIAAAWAVIDAEKEATGIAKLGTGLGVREIWQAMWEATRPPVVTDEVVERPPCPTCEGRGVYDSHPIPPDKGPAMEFECYACNGTGNASMPAVVSGGQSE